MNLREQARGRNCMVRLVGVCNFDASTTVLAHYRLIGLSGMGIKNLDQLGAWACSDCHSFVDTHKDDATARAFLEGVLRTQYALIREGKLK